MTTGLQAFIAVGLVLVLLALIFVALQLRKIGASVPKKKTGKDGQPLPAGNLNDVAAEEVGHLFNEEFREELRNRGRLHFEKIINENAMFLKQDLDMTIAQMNEYLKKEIVSKLDADIAAYAKAMQDAQELALASLKQGASAVEDQRVAMAEKLNSDVAAEEAKLIQIYEQNMSKIVEHYIVGALGDQFDLKSQLPFIVAKLQADKEAIMEDMRL